MLEISNGPVRIASADDADSLLRMCRMIHAESKTPEPFSADRTREVLEKVLPHGRNDINAGHTWIAVIGDHGRLKASSYLTIETPLFSAVPFLHQLWAFVDPEYRRSPYFQSLRSFAERRADELRMEARLIASHPAMDRLYGRMERYQPVGTVYSYRGNCA